ncbi:DUF4328 domain-containing protein [Streptomyces cylindrosporus]|uniref:DUF4328 domain-containing protein n=1 Tax=Streptomyces cylindrosporus TaxID=2927583 RepID=A0ABS9YCD5_9ACTN|nr:DUF4328 domain-containing protein [Streptomyces cylindrosporus]MCI3274868.1 DUF4328 domain-containing protein [Streptomyces cylindrosporus]
MNAHITPPAAAPLPAPALRPVRSAALFTTGALGLAGAAWVLRAVWEVRLSVAGEPASGPPDQGGGTHRALNSLEDSYHFVNTAGGFAALLCAGAFIGWMWRIRDNGRALSGVRPRYSGIWVYLGWIVPVVNLWFPRGIIADAYLASTPGAPGARVPRSLNVWWGLWLVTMVGGVGLIYTDSTDEIIGRAYDDVWQLLTADAAVVGAAVAGIFMVRAVTAVQEKAAG